MKIAIVGSGISGLGAAYALKDVCDVTVFEASAQPGGHSHTVDFELNGRALSTDVGFIVYNGLNYPNLTGLFDALGVETQKSDMSFSVQAPGGFEWSSNGARGLFARKRNLLRPRYLKFLTEILRFNRAAISDLDTQEIGPLSFGAWLDKHGFSEDLREHYILPMGAAIWSTPEARMTDYPATSFINFFNNHRLLHSERPKWRTVTGGSKQYVAKIAALLEERLRTNTPVRAISRAGEAGLLVFTDGVAPERFDHVILAGHADQSLALLGEDFTERRFPLGSTRFQSNHVVLHSDPTFMPRRRATWASWNVFKQDDGRLCLTYWMNRLQGLPEDCPVFVTLNPDRMPREDLMHFETHFDHPLFDGPAAAAVREIKRHNGENGLWFAGAWMGHGFHEDGLKSGLEAALSIGGRVPWSAEGVDIRSPATPAAPDILPKSAEGAA